MVYPIYIDHIVAVSSEYGGALDLTLPFKITDYASNVLYEGTLVRLTTSSANYEPLYLNRLSESWLRADYDWSSSAYFNTTSYRHIHFYVWGWDPTQEEQEEEEWVEVEGTYEMVWNYTYTDSTDLYNVGESVSGTSKYLNDNISNIIDSRMYLPFSVFEITHAGGTHRVQYDESLDYETFNWTAKNLWTYRCNRTRYINGEHTIKLLDDLGSTGRKVYYTKKNYCDYGIYYVNRRGAIDFLCCKGNGYKTDNFNQTKITQSALNTNLGNFATEVKINEITRTWKISTDYLTDSESFNLSKNLLSSPKVWLHDLENDRLVAVTIKNSTADYQYFKGGKKLPRYTIELEESQKERILLK